MSRRKRSRHSSPERESSPSPSPHASREYKRFQYSEESLEKALTLIKEGTLSLNKASKDYGIPRGTLFNKVHGKVPQQRKMGPATILSEEEEREVTNWIISKAKVVFPLHGEDVKDSIQDVLKECPRPNPFKDSRPGSKWLSLFLKRHPEIHKMNAEVISKARASVTEQSLRTWFQELKKFLSENNRCGIFEDGRRVLNCDETGCQTCPKTGKVLGPKGFKNLYEICSGSEKESITVLCTYSADGSALPPIVVYPYKRIPQHILRNMPEGWALGRSDSGWMVSATFLEYVSKVVLGWLKERGTKFPVILFLDGHKSHLSMELSKLCAENQIIVFCLPPNATHIIQPCDVDIFRPLKVARRNVVRNSKQKNVVITKLNFAGFFKIAFDSVNRHVIQKSFEACGLFPLNEDAIDYTKCISVRSAEIDKENDESENSVEFQPTLADYVTTRKVIEFSIGREKLATFHESFGNGTNEDCGDLFLLWKTSYIKTAGDKETSEKPGERDIMNMPMIIVENCDSTMNNQPDENFLPNAQGINMEDDAVSESSTRIYTDLLYNLDMSDENDIFNDLAAVIHIGECILNSTTLPACTASSTPKSHSPETGPPLRTATSPPTSHGPSQRNGGDSVEFVEKDLPIPPNNGDVGPTSPTPCTATSPPTSHDPSQRNGGESVEPVEKDQPIPSITENKP